MKKYIALIALFAGITNAETIPLPTPLNVGGTIQSINVNGVNYNSEDNSWIIQAEPNITYPAPVEDNGVSANVSIVVRLVITVHRAEIESALGIADVGNATVDQLNSTVRTIAMSKALAALTP